MTARSNRIGSGLRRLLLCFGMALLALPALATTLEAPQQVIKGVSDQLMGILRSDRQLLEKDPTYVYRVAEDVFSPHIDFDRVASLAMGRYWRRADTGQRAAFIRGFKRLKLHTYATALRELSDWEVTYTPLRMRPDQTEAVVRTQVNRDGGQPVDVEYRMHLRQGAWLAYDVKIEGISLISNYRSSFTTVARNKGIDGLIEELAAMNATRAESS